MPGPGERGEAVVIELQHVDVRRRQRHGFDVDGEMTLAMAKRVDNLRAPAWHPARAHRGRDLLKPQSKWLHQDKLADLARGNGEVALGLRRVEGLGRSEQALHAGKDDMHGGGEIEGLRRRHETLARAHEELVGEDFTKLGKGMTDGRGATPEALCRPRDARIHEQRIEDDKKIGVDFLQMHGCNDSAEKISLRAC